MYENKNNIIMVVGGMSIPMDKDIKLFTAVDRANIYKKRNPKARFIVQNVNGDIEYEA